MLKKRISSQSNAIYTLNYIHRSSIAKYLIQDGVFYYYVFEKEDYPYDYTIKLSSEFSGKLVIRTDKKIDSQFANCSEIYKVQCKKNFQMLNPRVEKALLKLRKFYIYIYIQKGQFEFNLTSENLLSEEEWVLLNELILALKDQFKLDKCVL